MSARLHYKLNAVYHPPSSTNHPPWQLHSYEVLGFQMPEEREEYGPLAKGMRQLQCIIRESDESESMPSEASRILGQHATVGKHPRTQAHRLHR